MDISSTWTPNLVKINDFWSEYTKVPFCGQTSEHSRNRIGKKNLDLSQNKAQNESAPGVKCNPLFWCNSCFFCRMAPLTTDGAIFDSEGTSNRLLARQHKIKIQILLEKLTCNCNPTVLCISCQRRLSNDQKKTYQLTRKAFCLQKCLSIYGRWVMRLLSVESCYLSGVWIISHRAEVAHTALTLSAESQCD